jgi:hypothetical protein
MRFTTAMLADAAQVQGGKLFVLGGGFDTISAKTLPVVHRSLTVALVAEIDPDERHRHLEIMITLMDEDGNTLGVEAKGKLRVGAPANLPPGSSSVVPMVSPFYNVRFEHAKGYAFVVSHDNAELARITFRVVEV